jgi:hypothetical protein
MSQILTTADLNRMTGEDDWAGFGYLGDRKRALDNSDPQAPAQPEKVAEMDRQVLAEANRKGMTYAELFAWANSKTGRWFGECFLSGSRHTSNYSPRREGLI